MKYLQQRSPFGLLLVGFILCSFLSACKKPRPAEPAQPCLLSTLTFSRQIDTPALTLDGSLTTTIGSSGTQITGLSFTNELVSYKGRYNFDGNGLPTSFDEIDESGKVLQKDLATFSYEQDPTGKYRLKTYRQVSYFNRFLVNVNWSFTYDSNGLIKYVYDQERQMWYTLETSSAGNVVTTRHTTWTGNTPGMASIPTSAATFTTKENPFLIIPLPIRLHLFYLTQSAYYHTPLNFEQILSRNLIDTYTMGNPAYNSAETFTHTGTGWQSSVDNFYGKGKFSLQYTLRCQN
ncbi:hypothetical protein [Spirosoma agri]|uniref:DUF4595 domain-containing protein n=1 Tax=Spirosoma agri TaxID=1987381 RepID=A0A6M0IM47_9BACT|nr:hypothetical protein [Spirosoma agri]NEU67963.1 hypothetical protein [Spirosoma agri]